MGSGVVGAVVVKGEDRDVVVELDTVTFTEPGKAVSVAVIAAVSCVALTNVVSGAASRSNSPRARSQNLCRSR